MACLSFSVHCAKVKSISISNRENSREEWDVPLNFLSQLQKWRCHAYIWYLSTTYYFTQWGEILSGVALHFLCRCVLLFQCSGVSRESEVDLLHIYFLTCIIYINIISLKYMYTKSLFSANLVYPNFTSTTFQKKNVLWNWR